MSISYERFGFLDHDAPLAAPLRLCDFGLEQRCFEAYDFDNRLRDNYEGYLFQYTLSGIGCFETPDGVLTLDAGKAFFVDFPSNTRYYLPTGGTWTFFYMHFTGAFARPFFDYLLTHHGHVFQLSPQSPVITRFFEVYQHIQGGKQFEPYESGVFLYEWLTCLLKEVTTPSSYNGNNYVQQAVSWMQRHYMTPCSLTEMSQTLGVSLPHLSRQFHTEKGLTPMTYLTNLRLEKSLTLLLNTPLSIQDIATQCGFTTGNYYAKVFRKVMGMTPTAYRTHHGILFK